MLAIWALGAAVFLVWQIARLPRASSAELGRSRAQPRRHRGLPLVESAAVQGPLALGLLDRRIVVPADFATRYSAAERRLALDHESVHHRRGDIWWNLAGLFILALNWFNPVAWLAFRAFRADQELACDAAVAAAALGRRPSRLCPRPDQIREPTRPDCSLPAQPCRPTETETENDEGPSQQPRPLAGGAAFILAVAGLGAAVGTPGLAQPDAPKQDQAQPPEERQVERRIIIREHDGEPQAGDHREHRERVIVMSHRGEGHGDGDHARHVEIHRDGHEVVIPDCDHGQADEVNEGTDHDRTRIVLCSRGEATPAERAERLARVRDRLAGDSELSAEQKARVTAAIDREIARLGGNKETFPSCPGNATCRGMEVEQVHPRVRRLLAPNPSPFTYTGTQTYIVGERRGRGDRSGPGPAPSMSTRILAATQGERIAAILCTHTHRDHSPASRPLAAAAGAPIVGCAPAGARG